MKTKKISSKQDEILSSLAAQNQQMKDYLNHIATINIRLKDYNEKISSSKVYTLWQKFVRLLNKPSKLLIQIKLESEFNNWSKKKYTDKFDVLIFGVINYDFRHQRPQHLAEELAKRGHRIFYIEPEFTKSNSIPTPLISKMKQNLYKIKLASATKETKKMFVYYNKILPEDKLTLIDSVKLLLQQAYISKPIIKVDNPSWVFIVEKLGLPIIYDCIDDHGAFETKAERIELSESNLVKKSDAVVIVSKGLALKIKNKYKLKDHTVIGNAGEYSHFANAIKQDNFLDDLKSIKKPILGYCGAIGEWFDVELLEFIAQKYQSSSIVLIGYPDNPKVRELKEKYHNIYILGEKNYKILPKYYQNFDICLIPFLINELTLNLNPVKIYEYLATGKAIVTTNIPGLKEFSDLIYISKNRNDFCENIKKGLNEKNIRLILNRQAFAKNNTWEKRAIQLESVINRLTDKKL